MLAVGGVMGVLAAHPAPRMTLVASDAADAYTFLTPVLPPLLPLLPLLDDDDLVTGYDDDDERSVTLRAFAAFWAW